jgi:hypothetical protein
MIVGCRQRRYTWNDCQRLHSAGETLVGTFLPGHLRGLCHAFFRTDKIRTRLGQRPKLGRSTGARPPFTHHSIATVGRRCDLPGFSPKPWNRAAGQLSAARVEAGIFH